MSLINASHFSTSITNSPGFYENEDAFYSWDYEVVGTYLGPTHFWVWIVNCTEGWIPLQYPSVYNSPGDQFDATFTFHTRYASVLSNGELLWTFNYRSKIAMDSCPETIEKFFSNAFLYYADDYVPRPSDSYRLVTQVSNDTEIDIPSNYKDFSQYTNSDGDFAEFFSTEPLQYDFISAPLQLKTEDDIPNMSNFTLNLLNSNGERVSAIVIGFLDFAAFYEVYGCTDLRILFPMPEPLAGTAGTRIWTIDPSDNEIVIRCNGFEIGRVAREGDQYLDTCNQIFGDKVSGVELSSETFLSVFYRILCFDCYGGLFDFICLS